MKHSVNSYGRKTPLIIIEHLEDHFSLWIRAEYRHAKQLAGERLVFTNLGEFLANAREENLCPCFSESITELQGILYNDPGKVIILDPLAEKLLEPQEAANAEALVIGGILGDNPPRGRTRQLLTQRAKNMLARSLGPHQLSIDGAVYVTLRVAEGTPLEKIPLVHRPRLYVDIEGLEVEIELPFSYPLVNGEPLISDDVKELLARGLGYEEYRESRGTR